MRSRARSRTDGLLVAAVAMLFVLVGTALANSAAGQGGPTATVSPAGGARAGDTVAVEGFGFPPGEPVPVVFGGVTLATPVANDEGFVSTPATIPEIPPGAHPLDVGTVTIEYTVLPPAVAPAPAAPPTAAAPAPAAPGATEPAAPAPNDTATAAPDATASVPDAPTATAAAPDAQGQPDDEEAATPGDDGGGNFPWWILVLVGVVVLVVFGGFLFRLVGGKRGAAAPPVGVPTAAATTCDWTCVYIDEVSGTETVLKHPEEGAIECCRYEIRLSSNVRELRLRPEEHVSRWTDEYEVQWLGEGVSDSEESFRTARTTLRSTVATHGADNSARTKIRTRRGRFETIPGPAGGTLPPLAGRAPGVEQASRGRDDYFRDRLRRVPGLTVAGAEGHSFTSEVSYEETTELRITLRRRCGNPEEAHHVYSLSGDGLARLQPIVQCQHAPLCSQSFEAEMDARCRVSGALEYTLAPDGQPGPVRYDPAHGHNSQPPERRYTPAGPKREATVPDAEVSLAFHHELESKAKVDFAAGSIRSPESEVLGRTVVSHYVHVSGQTKDPPQTSGPCECGAAVCTYCQPGLDLWIGKPLGEGGDGSSAPADDEATSDARVVVGGRTWYLWRPQQSTSGRVAWSLEHEEAILAPAADEGEEDESYPGGPFQLDDTDTTVPDLETSTETW